MKKFTIENDEEAKKYIIRSIWKSSNFSRYIIYNEIY